MKKIILTTLIFISFNLHAFILINENGKGKLPDPPNVKFVMSNDACANIGISKEALKDYVIESINRYWNTVETSSLFIEDGGELTGVVPATNQIMIHCQSQAWLGTCYPEATGSSYGGVGVVYINNNATNNNCWATRSYGRLLYVMAHEIGHGLGLHHSKDPASIMTYESHGWKSPPSALSQDDKDGITYLYPSDKEAGGLLGSCGTVALLSDDEGPNNGPPWNFLLSIALGFLLILMMRRGFNRIACQP